MNRLGIVNMFVGFFILFLSMSGGAFLGLEVTEAFVKDPQWLESWNLNLLRSAHNHFNQFGYLFILFGLTIPYSRWNTVVKKWQTFGLGSGALAMGPGMLWKASQKPSLEDGVMDYLLGFLVSMALLAVVTHGLGLAKKLVRS